MVSANGLWKLLAALAAGCVLATPGMTADAPKISPAIVPNFNLPDLSAANNAYRLSPEELTYDCKKLTGHIRLRIRQLRSTTADTKTSSVARTMQRAATPFVGGTTRGIDPDGDNARDRTMVIVYNGRLAAKSCPTFDLERLLAPGNTDDPSPAPKARKAPPTLFKAAKP